MTLVILNSEAEILQLESPESINTVSLVLSVKPSMMVDATAVERVLKINLSKCWIMIKLVIAALSFGAL